MIFFSDNRIKKVSFFSGALWKIPAKKSFIFLKAEATVGFFFFWWVLLKHLDDHMEPLVVPWDHAAMKSDHYLPSDSWSLYTIRKFSDF